MKLYGLEWPDGKEWPKGGWLQPGDALAVINTGRPEPVLTKSQHDELRRRLER